MAVDFACAALPLIVVAEELAFAAPAINEFPPVAVAVAIAVPPSIARIALPFASDANAGEADLLDSGFALFIRLCRSGHPEPGSDRRRSFKEISTVVAAHVSSWKMWHNIRWTFRR